MKIRITWPSSEIYNLNICYRLTCNLETEQNFLIIFLLLLLFVLSGMTELEEINTTAISEQFIYLS